MNPALKTLYVIRHILSTTLIVIIGIVVGLAIFFPYVIITLPYTLIFFSSNWSMRQKHAPAVETYLHYFEQLHPDLMAYVVAAHDACGGDAMPNMIKYWPHKTKRTYLPLIVVNITEEQTTFKHAAGLFARLEEVGWKRKLVWEFLRDKVEQSGLPTPEERAAFAKSMKVMNSHNIVSPQWGPGSIFQAVSRRFRDQEKRRAAQQEAETAAAAKYAYLGRPVEHVRRDSLEWLLHRGALLLPDEETRMAVRRLSGFVPVWAGFRKDSDLEKGVGECWQLADARDIRPWTDK